MSDVVGERYLSAYGPSGVRESNKSWLDWDGFAYLIDHLAQELETQVDPDVVLGVARGGLPGATRLSHALDVDLAVVNAAYYTGEEQKDTITIGGLYGIGAGLVLTDKVKEQSVLVFDDLVDSGTTMSAVVSKLRRCGFEDIETAVLFEKPSTEFEPDYSMGETSDWIVFPWEVYS